MPKPQSVPLKETHFPVAGGCQRRNFILSFLHSSFIQSVSHSVMQPFNHSVSDKSLSFLHFLSVVHLVKYYCIHLCNPSFLSTPAFIEWFSYSGNSGSLNLVFSQLFIQSCIHSFIHPFNSFWLVVWNMNFMFPYIGNNMNNHPIWRTQRSRLKPPTRKCYSPSWTININHY